MSKLKRFKIGLFTITLGMVLVGASFALADDKAIAEGIILPEELNETTAILTPSVAIAENEPTTQSEEWIDAVATAYCPCEICCGKWALNRPDCIVYTASGAIAEEGVTIAADWSVYSPGTILYIEGIGERTVQDRGGAISGQKIDVFFNSHEDALRFGRQEVRIKVISDTEVNFPKPWKKNATGTPTSGSLVTRATTLFAPHKTKPNVLCTAKKAFASTEVESPKAWPSNWLTR